MIANPSAIGQTRTAHNISIMSNIDELGDTDTMYTVDTVLVRVEVRTVPPDLR